MKQILLIFTLFITCIASAQKPITKAIGDFSILKVYDLIHLELIKSDVNKVEITGKNSQNVMVVNKNGKLKIKMNIEKIYDGSDTEVKLYFTHIDTIDANEGAFIASRNIFEQYHLELRAQEGGQIKLNVKTDALQIKAVSGGLIELSGTTKHQDIHVNTGGILKSKALKSKVAKLDVKAGGEVDVNATEFVDVKIRAGGDVCIYGNPRQVQEDKVLGGRIRRMD
ncbi:MAG: DUF2807 domain-containing protein [Flavobacteriaceae bacterium]|nr:DUF2807 domain-containing protein [Flavobacteriaceae bacterium]